MVTSTLLVLLLAPPTDKAEPTVLQGTPGTVWSLAFSGDGKLVAGGFHDGSARVWEAATGKERHTFIVQKSWDRGVAFNADGTLLATAAAGPLPIGRPGRIVLWDLQSGKTVRTLEDGDAGGVAFSPDGKLLVGTATGQPALLKLWDTTTGKVVRSLDDSGLDGTTGVPVAFSPDGQYIAGAGRNGEVKIWEASTGKVLHTLAGSDARSVNFSPVAFSADSKRVVAGGLGAVIVWEVATAKKLVAINQAHVNGVVGVAFSPDGKRLISAGNRPHRQRGLEPFPPVDDGEVTVWDAEKGKEQRSFATDAGGTRAVAVSADGKRIAVSPYDSGKPVRIWAVDE